MKLMGHDAINNPVPTY